MKKGRLIAGLAYGHKLNLLFVSLGILVSMTPAWWLIINHDAAWALGVFAWPFILFGAATTLAWHRMSGSKERTHLYVGELSGAVIGLVFVGPLLLSLLPINVLGTIGVQTHLRNTVEREGLVDHQHATSAYARTDVIRTNRESVVYFFTDAMFVTRAVAWDGKSPYFSDPHVEDLARLKRLALQSARRDNVLLLGSGAGFDTAVALQEGAAHIDAVEVNPQTIQIARGLDSWAGGVFESPRVSTHIAEARRFIASSDNRWDQINLNLLQTSPAAGRGRSHVDARVLTVEAIQDYLNHLQPHGVLTVIQNSAELASRTNAAIHAANGGNDDRIVGLHLSGSDNPFSHLLIARNKAFTKTEIEQLLSLASRFGAETTPPPCSPGTCYRR